jgi:hypothetical protein
LKPRWRSRPLRLVWLALITTSQYTYMYFKTIWLLLSFHKIISGFVFSIEKLAPIETYIILIMLVHSTQQINNAVFINILSKYWTILLKKKYDYWWKKYGLEKTKTSLFDRNWAILLKPRSEIVCGSHVCKWIKTKWVISIEDLP